MLAQNVAAQPLQQVLNLIRLSRYTADGICQALAAKWIIQHANDDGKSVNRTSKNKYPLGMTYQDYVTERYMGIYGVQRRKMVFKGFLGNQHHFIATGAEDFVFFDPNFGEFWFLSHEKFQAWFKGYWSTSGYNRIFDGFYLLPYGKEI